MTTMAGTFSRTIRRPRVSVRRICQKKGCLERFRYFIEHSEWDKEILIHEERMNKICVGVIITFILYFTPVLVKIFLR